MPKVRIVPAVFLLVLMTCIIGASIIAAAQDLTPDIYSKLPYRHIGPEGNRCAVGRPRRIPVTEKIGQMCTTGAVGIDDRQRLIDTSKDPVWVGYERDPPHGWRTGHNLSNGRIWG